MSTYLRPLNFKAIDNRVTGKIGRRIQYFPELDSTSAFLLNRGISAADHGEVVIAEFQTAGRGRMNRVWAAPRYSSLLLSVVLSWPQGVPLAQSVMLAALAVTDTVRESLTLAPTLKWPNDVLLDGRKVCGILGESTGGEPTTVVLGIGLNVNFDPATVPGVPADATSLATALGRPIAREPLLVSLVNYLEMWYCDLTRNQDAVFAAWSSLLDLPGRRVSVRDPVGSWEGEAVAVQPDGGLRVRQNGGQERLVYAADVSLRGHTGVFTSQ
jgi:BirA family transcriptional regulator, biotin operon repressor / biotin---[acetyl-CoA-carboxylase] ligase